MAEKVRWLGGSEKYLPGETIDVVVEHLKDLLERAEAGQIHAIAVAYIEPDLSCNYGVSGTIGVAPRSLLGALRMASRQVEDIDLSGE